MKLNYLSLGTYIFSCTLGPDNISLFPPLFDHELKTITFKCSKL